jgi:hypothetical protein
MTARITGLRNALNSQLPPIWGYIDRPITAAKRAL